MILEVSGAFVFLGGLLFIIYSGLFLNKYKPYTSATTASFSASAQAARYCPSLLEWHYVFLSHPTWPALLCLVLLGSFGAGVSFPIIIIIITITIIGYDQQQSLGPNALALRLRLRTLQILGILDERKDFHVRQGSLERCCGMHDSRPHPLQRGPTHQSTLAAKVASTCAGSDRRPAKR